MEANIASLRDLKENLRVQRRKGVSLVLQCNKRDMPDAVPVSQIVSELGLSKVTCLEAVASTGRGVFTTLRAVSRLVLTRLHRQFEILEGRAL